MKIWKKLQSPFALVIQGFMVGALLFVTVQPLSDADRAAPASAGGSMLENLQV